MLLRSNWTATRIADPSRSLTLEAFQAATDQSFLHSRAARSFRAVRALVPAPGCARCRSTEDFTRRGRFQRLSAHSGGRPIFRSRRVVVAVGIGSFAWRPASFRVSQLRWRPTLGTENSSCLPGRRYSWSAPDRVHSNRARCCMRAALRLRSSLGHTRIHWLQGRLSKTLHHGLGRFTTQMLYAPTDVGPAGISQLMARPDLLRRLPRGLQDQLRRRAVRPAGARWLVKRLENVPITLGRSVVSVLRLTGERVVVKLDDGSGRIVDHVLLGTGYRVDIRSTVSLRPSSLGRSNASMATLSSGEG